MWWILRYFQTKGWRFSFDGCRAEKQILIFLVFRRRLILAPFDIFTAALALLPHDARLYIHVPIFLFSHAGYCFAGWDILSIFLARALWQLLPSISMRTAPRRSTNEAASPRHALTYFVRPPDKAALRTIRSVDLPFGRLVLFLLYFQPFSPLTPDTWRLFTFSRYRYVSRGDMRGRDFIDTHQFIIAFLIAQRGWLNGFVSFSLIIDGWCIAFASHFTVFSHISMLIACTITYITIDSLIVYLFPPSMPSISAFHFSFYAHTYDDTYFSAWYIKSAAGEYDKNFPRYIHIFETFHWLI